MFKEERKCAWCGKSFTTTNAHKRYCSEYCHKEMRKRRMINGKPKCAMCGIPYDAVDYRQIYCDDCKRLSNIKTKECLSCHNLFKTTTATIYCDKCAATHSGVYKGAMPWIGKVHSEDWKRVGGKYRPCNQKKLAAAEREANKKGISYGMMVAMRGGYGVAK